MKTEARSAGRRAVMGWAPAAAPGRQRSRSSRRSRIPHRQGTARPSRPDRARPTPTRPDQATQAAAAFGRKAPLLPRTLQRRDDDHGRTEYRGGRLRCFVHVRPVVVPGEPASTSHPPVPFRGHLLTDQHGGATVKRRGEQYPMASSRVSDRRSFLSKLGAAVLGGLGISVVETTEASAAPACCNLVCQPGSGCYVGMTVCSNSPHHYIWACYYAPGPYHHCSCCEVGTPGNYTASGYLCG
jgi:hypothetical protein